jgi:transcriptional regulator with XRE-family HTH domain
MSETGLKPSMEARALIGRILSDIMDRSGLTNEQIATRAGIKRNYIYKIRSGKHNPTIDAIGAICAACQTNLGEWVDRQSAYGKNRKIHTDVEYVLNYGGGPEHALKTVIQSLMTHIAQLERERNTHAS